MRGPVRALGAVLLLGLLASPAARAASKPPAWPANVRLIEARLGAEAYASFSVELPQFRLYDSQGWRLANTAGYEGGRFARLLDSLLSGKGTPDGHLLADDLPRFQAPDGKRLAEVPAADFTIVEYWADWCQPCHKQTADLVRMLGKYPKLKVNVVYVDSSPPGMEGGKATAP